MKKTILTIALLAAAAAAPAQELCAKGQEYLQTLRSEGQPEFVVKAFLPSAQLMCAQAQKPAPTTAEEYQRQQQAEQKRRVDEMKATPEKKVIRLWD